MVLTQWLVTATLERKTSTKLPSVQSKSQSARWGDIAVIFKAGVCLVLHTKFNTVHTFYSSQIRNVWGSVSLTEGCRYQRLIYHCWNQGNALVFPGSDPPLLCEGLLNVTRQGRLWSWCYAESSTSVLHVQSFWETRVQRQVMVIKLQLCCEDQLPQIHSHWDQSRLPCFHTHLSYLSFYRVGPDLQSRKMNIRLTVWFSTIETWIMLSIGKGGSRVFNCFAMTIDQYWTSLN